MMYECETTEAALKIMLSPNILIMQSLSPREIKNLDQLWPTSLKVLKAYYTYKATWRQR